MPVAKIEKLRMDMAPLKRLAKRSPKLFIAAEKKGAIQFLNWANNGSAGSSKTPPIRFGVLRGSSSAFVGNEMVGVFDIAIKAGAKERPTPAQSHSAAPTTITWVWNTNYSARMHEWTGGWGKYTIQAGNAGNKWIEEHLRTDAEALIEFIGADFRKAAGL